MIHHQDSPTIANPLRTKRRAYAAWSGDLLRGSGTVTAESHAFADLPVTWASRSAGSAGQTSPEELIAAAHAGCYAMALSLVLTEGGTPPQALRVGATCVFEKVTDGFAITSVDLDVRGQVSGLGADGFDQAAVAAAHVCPVSKALKGNVVVNVKATLKQ